MTAPPHDMPPSRLPVLEQGPLPALRARIAAGLLDEDPAQGRAAERLQALWQGLQGYDCSLPPPAGPAARMWRRLRRLTAAAGRRSPPPPPLRGLYLVGPVGRGKSMLMDLFFATAPLARKQRWHFHHFLQMAHRRFHAFQHGRGTGADPIPPLADAIAAEAALLCFDEFEVHDIADAMILGRLFAALFARGVVVVATSNTSPDDLFKGRPGRDAFLPFIALLKRHLEVVPLEGPRDWRRGRLCRLGTWHVPADIQAERALDAAFAELSGGVTPAPVRIALLGRVLEVPLAGGGVARFDFESLCGRPLGPPDYLALAARFHTLLIDAIPRMGAENFDRARRFITLIDALYEHRCKLIASAADWPDRLYQRGENAAIFARTASRLIEMQSEAYLTLPHSPMRPFPSLL